MRLLTRCRLSFGFATRDEDWLRKYFFGGLWILLCPPFGWYMALGYRTEVGIRLQDGVKPVLPTWEGWRRYLVTGLRSGGVIQSFFVPYLLTLWLFAYQQNPVAVVQHWQAMLVFAATVVLLPPVGIGMMPAVYFYLFPWFSVSGGEAALLSVLFFGAAFMMPSAFMQVLRTRKYSSAFRLDRVVAFIAAHFVAYLEAWLVSLASVGVAMATGVFAPWGLFWTYPAITYAFQSTFQDRLLISLPR